MASIPLYKHCMWYYYKQHNNNNNSNNYVIAGNLLGTGLGTTSVVPGTAAVVLRLVTASRTACTMLGMSGVIKGWVAGC